MRELACCVFISLSCVCFSAKEMQKIPHKSWEFSSIGPLAKRARAQEKCDYLLEASARNEIGLFESLLQ